MDLLSSATKQQSDKPANQLPPKQTEIKLEPWLENTQIFQNQF